MLNRRRTGCTFRCLRRVYIFSLIVKSSIKQKTKNASGESPRRRIVCKQKNKTAQPSYGAIKPSYCSMVGTSARLIHAPFVRKAGGLQSTGGAGFPLKECWIIKTAMSRTRQYSFF